jgi:hypothetical protein
MSKRIAAGVVSVLSVLGFVSLNGYAQPKDAADDQTIITYIVRAGDTLAKISQRYLVAGADLGSLQKSSLLKTLNQLPVGLELEIPRELVRFSPSIATVMGLSCASSIRLNNSPKPLEIGTRLQEGAVIDVPPECHVALLLEDGSMIRLPSSATLKITTLRKSALESAPEVRLDLSRGRIELEVHKGRAKTTPFEIRTPLSVMGVRGTEFRVGYSPEDQSAQVEVLGGVVQARGAKDNNALEITKGLGMPIDGKGKSLGVEYLLDAPRIQTIDITKSAQPSFVARLQPVALAQYYIADSSSTANLSGTRSSQHLLSPEFFIPRLSKQATFFQLTSVSQSELVGTERNYAFCSATGDGKSARCSALFDVPLADNGTIAFVLNRIQDGVSQPVVNTQNLQARNGRFSIQGLPSGQYAWTLSYSMRPTQPATAVTTTVQQSGMFELITVSSTPP